MNLSIRFIVSFFVFHYLWQKLCYLPVFSLLCCNCQYCCPVLLMDLVIQSWSPTMANGDIFWSLQTEAGSAQANRELWILCSLFTCTHTVAVLCFMKYFVIASEQSCSQSVVRSLCTSPNASCTACSNCTSCSISVVSETLWLSCRKPRG